MSHVKRIGMLGVFALLFTVGQLAACAEDGKDGIKTVFVIAMENHNWTQPANQFTGGIQQIFQNPNAPFINSLVNGTATAVINGRQVNISEQTAFATNYRNVLATAGRDNPHIHPSEPNYIWAEAGTNFGVFNDNDPFAPASGTGRSATRTINCTLRLFDQCGASWKSYQEDIDLVPDGTSFDNVVLPADSMDGSAQQPLRNLRQWRQPIQRLQPVQLRRQAQSSGLLHRQNGGNDSTTTNPLACNTLRCSSCSPIWPTITVAALQLYHARTSSTIMHTTLTARLQRADWRRGQDPAGRRLPAADHSRDHGVKGL